jgi:hypothetical protein
MVSVTTTALEVVRRGVHETLIRVCGGGIGGEDSPPSLFRDVQELDRISVTTTSWTTKNGIVSDDTPSANLDGQPWNINVRTAPALFHRWKNQRTNDGASCKLVLTSDTGVQRVVDSPVALARVMLPILEELVIIQAPSKTHGEGSGLRHDDMVWSIQVQEPSGFLCVTTFSRMMALRAAGRLPCPACPHWARGTKGLWWHCQQFHSWEHSMASRQAERCAASSSSSTAMIVYDQGQNGDPWWLWRGRQANASGETTNSSCNNQRIPQPIIESTADLGEASLKAICEGDLVKLRQCVEKLGFDPVSYRDRRGSSPLSWACGAGHVSGKHFKTKAIHRVTRNQWYRTHESLPFSKS